MFIPKDNNLNVFLDIFSDNLIGFDLDWKIFLECGRSFGERKMTLKTNDLSSRDKIGGFPFSKFLLLFFLF